MMVPLLAMAVEDPGCVPKTKAEVEARISQIFRIIRTDRACQGPLGLLAETPTAHADQTRVAHRRCGADVARKLDFRMITTASKRIRQYEVGAKASKVPMDSVTTLQLNGVDFVAQQYWDLLVYDLFFKGAPPRPRRFFEAGARNGILESNTYFFEKHLGWSGLLVEPTIMSKCMLPLTRPRATVVHGAFCNAPFLARNRNYLGDIMSWACNSYGPDVQNTMECFRWKDFVSTYRVDRLDLWSLDIDDADEQLQILSKMDLSSASRPSVIIIEASIGTIAKYKQILHANGYLTTHLEDNGKRRNATYIPRNRTARQGQPVTAKPRPTPGRRYEDDGKRRPASYGYPDILACHDTCAAWK